MDRSPLAKLSPELRNSIWKLLVTEDEPLQVSVTLPTTVVPPPITKVCRQIRSECHLMFYAMNTFRLDIPSGDECAAEGEAAVTDLFQESVAKAILWMEAVMVESHKVVSLELHVAVNSHWVHYDMKDRAGSWKELVTAMKACGYGEPRTVVTVQHHFDGGLSRDGESQIREAFGTLGLDGDKMIFLL
ncbi:hypothetical protein LTR36_004396 [Oleoguttula mirabilis]|uniref:Uncharacterized protein n=1 Tax=Oleoguttula mirabilis TaxID=1507867 RepID=A0AAV9JFU0_9PEZI|nr:hypothetical protein LTR36_004396 [Oleoguttula mirabilis]